MLRLGLVTSPLAFGLLRRMLFARTSFKPTPERLNFSSEEEATLKFWQETDAFKQQLQKTKHLPAFTFYDGPPFATGLPHYGHIAAGTIKDVVCRYAAQTGHYVQRRFGWDCHGLPVQYEIDKQLKITDRRQVIEMGIAQYNAACRGIVMRYSGQWESVIGRFGRWIDFQNDYKTMDISFMESVWNVFQQMYNKGMVYRGRRVMPYSNACSTVLSNFEVQQNYKQTDDPAIHVAFTLVEDPTVSLVAWTTTPWTLPSNLALAVNPNFTYVKVKDPKRGQTFILAETRLKDFFGKDKYEVIQKMSGKQLEGKQYVPLFNYFADRAKSGCFRVQIASFVTDSDGTGVVHCAPGFGEEDYKLCVEKGLIKPNDPPVPLDENGRFTSQIPQYQGKGVKESDEFIINDLKASGKLIKKGVIRHNYPFCWRSQTPLIYKAVSTWFIRVSQMREDLVSNNHKATWVPKAIQEKKFDNWLKEAKDWCFSRNRFWGNPIPLWVSDDGEQVVCVGSIKQLQQLTGVKVTDLHRENVDHLTIESKMGKGKLRRIEEVFDCWFESGAMPFAQVHYPFRTNQEAFSKIFPADFIGEGIDQTRGWFYTLNVIATALRNSHPYKNLIVNGLVLTQDGKKMSKRLKNYPDPMEVCNQFGADAVRLYLINSPLVRADNLNFSKDGVRAVVRDIFLPWYNCYRLMIQCVSKWQSRTDNTFKYNPDISTHPGLSLTDKWILGALQQLLESVKREMTTYKLYNVVPQMVIFLERLTNWYVRLNRGRLRGEADMQQMNLSLNVLFDVLLKANVLMAPIVPFFTEHMYQNMKLVIDPSNYHCQSSIHHVSISNPNPELRDARIATLMDTLVSIIETTRKLRQTRKISLKQPLTGLALVTRNPKLLEELQPYLQYILEQANVINVQLELDVDRYLKLQALPNLPVLGPKFKGDARFGALRTAIAQLNTIQLEGYRQTGKIEVNGVPLEENDLLVSEKFVTDNLKDYQAIGGSKVIVLLDTRQNESLRLKGLAREVTTRIQKLRKKAGVSTDDALIVFYRLGQKSPLLKQALELEGQNISQAVKRPLLQENPHFKLSQLASDQGTIEQEPYYLEICSPGPICDQTKLKIDFADKAIELSNLLLKLPYPSLKQKQSHQLSIGPQTYTLHEGIHYKLLI